MTLTKTFASAAFALLGYIAITSSAQASVNSDLNKCRFDTKQEVIGCCRQALRGHKKPQWMINAGSNCEKAAMCIGYYCYIGQRELVIPEREGGGNGGYNGGGNERGGEF